MAKWQHVIPQREQDHEVRPKNSEFDVSRYVGEKFYCWKCDKEIKTVADNDGPEGLKALLRL